MMAYAIINKLLRMVEKMAFSSKSLRLILEEFNLNKNQDEFLKIKGSSSLLGKSSKINIICNKKTLMYEESNIKYYIPLAKISCVSMGFKLKSLMPLIFGILFIILGLFSLVSSDMFGSAFSSLYMTFFIFGVVFIIVYAISSKWVYYGIYLSENTPMITVIIQKGITENIDIKNFELAAIALNEAVLANLNA
jgi:hypothetical protein